MLRATTLALAAACAVFGASASAHVGHARPDASAVCATASEAAAYFVTNDVGKEWSTLPPSWADIPPAEIEILTEVDGYFVTAVRNREEKKGTEAVIPSKRDRKVQREYDAHLYKARHLIENFFARLKGRYRAIATRYDKTAVIFLGAIHLAAAIDWLR